MPEHAGAEHERRQHAPAPAWRVELHPRPGAHHAHARHLAALAAIPLAQREVGDLVPLRGQALAEVAVPALGAADGVREQAVVDQADRASKRQRLADLALASPLSARLLPSPRVNTVATPAFEARPLSTLEQTTRPPSFDGEGSSTVKVSVVIPCLNEEASIERCVDRGARGARGPGLGGRGDRGRQRLGRPQRRARARRPARWWCTSRGAATEAPTCAGFAAAQGDYIVMADADLTYDFGDIPRFVTKLDEGADLVMGDRMRGIQPGAMPWLHRYVGNPVLTGILNLFFRTGVRDAHCGMRAVRRSALPRLDLRTTGMEFASEMVIRAGKERLEIEEIPIHYHPREGESKLSSFRDGWRHLRFLLVHSPTWLFIVPGAADGGARHADRPHRAASGGRARARVGPALDGRRRAADDRRHAGAGARALRPRLRHVLHGREGPLVRSHARALQAGARPAAGRRGGRSPGSWWPP